MKEKMFLIIFIGMSFSLIAQDETVNGNLIVNGGISMQNGILSLNPTNQSVNKMGIRNAYHGMLFYYDLPNFQYSLFLKENGSVGIGTYSTGSHKLAVEGSIGAREVKVELNSWPDFVFEKDFKLPTLNEVEKHIREKGHLKDIPSAKVVKENGIFLGKMNAKLLQKIEELTLYTIQQEKKIRKLELLNKKLLELQKRLDKLESR